MDEKDRIESEKIDEDDVNRNSANIWSNLTNTLMNLVAPCNSVSTCGEDFVGSGASCSSAPMVDSFGRELWDHARDPPLENFRYCNGSANDNSNISDPSGIRRTGPASFTSDIGWNHLNPMSKGGLYAQNAPSMLLGSFCVPQFPADSGFIERAARFSCFSGGNFNSWVNPFAIPESIGRHPVSPALMTGLVTGLMNIFPSDFVKSGSELNVETPEDVDMASREGTNLGCTQEKDGKGESVMRCHDGVGHGASLSSNDSDEGNYSGSHGGRANTLIADNARGEGSSKDFGLRKRKRNNGKEDGSDKANKAHEIVKNGGDSQQKVEHPDSTRGKGTERNNYQGTQTSDLSKGEYIHIRARRGQATNSHSLAEQVRREKISERMKLLQDLVPGCSKVTSKAVMLDEIINYVQSLQRQVESMKLATVNPPVDCNIEGLLAKEMIMPRAGPSTLVLSPRMHALPPGLVPPDAIRRAIHGQTAYKGTFTGRLSFCYAFARGTGHKIVYRAKLYRITVNRCLEFFNIMSLQLPHNWEDEVHNVILMGFGSGDTAPSVQDIDGSPTNR